MAGVHPLPRVRLQPQAALHLRISRTVARGGAGMIYRPRYNQVGAMTDSKACRAAFGHYDLNCPRCLQLKRGASPQLENEAQSAPARLHLVKRRPMNTITITVDLENEKAWQLAQFLKRAGTGAVFRPRMTRHIS